MVRLIGQAAQPVECTNCSDPWGVIGVLVAAAALVVSGYALYLGALRRPTIQVDHVEHEYQLRFPSWSGPTPAHVELVLKLVAANTGASGTYVEQLQLAGDYTVTGSDPFARFSPAGVVYRSGNRGAAVALPVALERGEVEPFELVGTFELSGEDAREVAGALHGFEAVELEVVWWYRRPDVLRPGRRRSVRAKQTVRADAWTLKRSAADHWGSQPAYDEEARILEAGA
jgi:hypothetical protein